MATKKTTQKLTQKQIKWLDKCTNIEEGWKGTWTLNPQTGLVDVKGNFNCCEQRLTSLQGVRFGVVTGDFDCSNNSLTSLEGSPQEVEGNFLCYYNSLTSLKGSPQEVEGDFDCSHNSLTSLKGSPQEVEGDFLCYVNSLTSLVGAPQWVGGDLDCYDNPVPEKVLEECYELMKSGKTYSEAVQEVWEGLDQNTAQKVWEGLDQNTKVLVYQPSFGWLSPEEHQQLNALQKYQQIKELI